MSGVFSKLIIVGICAFIALYFWTPSQVREYRVQVEQGIYQVRGVVLYGKDFTAFQSVDGKEAIEVCNGLNADLMRDRGGVLRSGKVAWSR